MEKFISHIRPYVPGCPDAWVAREVLGAAIEFCRDTLICGEDPGLDRMTKKLPKELYQNWKDEITAGALSRLFRMSGKNWYNLRLAALYQSFFLHGKGQAAIAAHKKAHPGMTVRQRPWV